LGGVNLFTSGTFFCDIQLRLSESEGSKAILEFQGSNIFSSGLGKLRGVL
jgi:hypothetical protein